MTTDEIRSDQHLVFMVTHGPEALFKISKNVKVVWLSTEPPPSTLKNEVISAKDFFPDTAERHRRLSGGLGCQVIYRYTETLTRRPEKITICAYRKFVHHRAFGEPAFHFKKIPVSNYYGMRILTPDGDGAAGFFKGVDGGGFCISPMRRFNNIVTQFAGAHSVEDLMLFLSACIKSQALTGHDAAEFLTMSEFIPGGLELGSYPYAFWQESMNRMMSAVNFFLQNYVASDDHGGVQQSRAISFCTERLGSFLLLKYLSHGKNINHISKNNFGYIHTVLTATPPRRVGLSLVMQRFRHKLYLSLGDKSL